MNKQKIYKHKLLRMDQKSRKSDSLNSQVQSIMNEAYSNIALVLDQMIRY